MSAGPSVAAVGGPGYFSWPQVVRLGLVQMALGAIVVLTTSTLNRVMVVELALPALLPGALVALHHVMQVTRPRMGHGSDVGGRRTPWIVGGMALLAASGALAALATAWMASRPVAGTALAALAFCGIGLGVSSAGTSLLVLLAKRVAPDRRAGSATVVWLMMIVGFAVTAGVAGRLLDPYSHERLVMVTAGVSAIAMIVTLLALAGVEGPTPAPRTADDDEPDPRAFRAALQAVWADPTARRFSLFVFISMLAYSAQDLILEPFAGAVLGLTPGQTTSLSGTQHAGVLLGMLMAGSAGRRWRGWSFGTLRGWIVGGCIASALAMAGLVAAAMTGAGWPLQANVFVLGAANGAFSVAAIGLMMALAGQPSAASGSEPPSEGIRMGLWGASQAIAFALGGLIGTAASDLAHRLFSSSATAYASVFALEAVLFIVAARIAARRAHALPGHPGARPSPLPAKALP